MVLSIAFLEQLLIGLVIAFLAQLQMLIRLILSREQVIGSFTHDILKRVFPLLRLFVLFALVLNLGKTRQVMCFD